MALAGSVVQDMALRLGRDPAASFNRHLNMHRPGNGETPTGNRVSLARIITISCLCLMAFTGFIMASVHLLGAEIARAGHSADASVRHIVMGNEVLDVPGNIIRFRSQRRSKTAQRLDLYLLWPQMAGYSQNQAVQFNQTDVNPQLLFLTLEQRAMSLDMSGRMEPIYSKFLLGKPQPAGHGLMKQALDEQDGFANEELWYEADSPYPYAARCTVPQSKSQAPYCLRDIHVGKDLMVTYRFHRALASQWKAIEASIRSHIQQMIAK